MKKNISKIVRPGEGWGSMLAFVSFLFTAPGRALLLRVVRKALLKYGLQKEHKPEYAEWIKKELDEQKIRNEFHAFTFDERFRPLISVIMAVHESDTTHLQAAIDSVMAQLYEQWELVLVNNCPGDEKVQSLLGEYAARNARIKIVNNKERNTLAGCYNTAAQQATGKFVFVMPQDGLLAIHFLFEIGKITQLGVVQVISTDEDEVDAAGNFLNPYFKPAWSPHRLPACNYLRHSVVLQRLLFDYVQFRDGFDGNELYELLLRASDMLELRQHIPRVLFHTRAGRPERADTAKKAVEAELKRRETPAEVKDVAGKPGCFHIRYDVLSNDKVSVIIPTKDQAPLLKTAVDSILAKTTYPDYEIIILNNNSASEEFFGLMKNYERDHPGKIRCVDANFPFNYSALMNLGARESKGRYLLLLNNDVEVIHDDWMTQTVSYTQLNETGAVGVKLLYPDNTIQHAGVAIGTDGEARHVYAHLTADTKGHYGAVQTATNYAAVTAACLMCRKELYLEVSGMNEGMAVEYNDIDLCLKFLALGHYTVYLPTVALYHHESATRGHPFRSKASWEHHMKELTMLKRAWPKFVEQDPFYNPNLGKVRVGLGMEG